MSPSGPSFAKPPVNEVALGVHFAPPPALRTTHAGLLWERWRSNYPRTEDHPVLPPVEGAPWAAGRWSTESSRGTEHGY